MAAVVGIDLSSKAIDLVKLNESDNQAEWVRCELHGKIAWERTLGVRGALTGAPVGFEGITVGWSNYWDDVYLVAIEAPYGRQQPGTQAGLNRVVGAVAASLPAHLRSPERCWVVRPDEWKRGLGLKSKPTWQDIERLTGIPFPVRGEYFWAHDDQNARDAYCLAMWARNTNRKAMEAA